jgi:cytochrome c biogenesis protein CcmG/thiol:disulfide interchange protein DsbE
MSGRLLAFAPLIALAALVLIGALLLVRGQTREHFSTGEAMRAAPVYSLERLGGGAPLSNTDLSGRAHLVNLFASWCTPCRAEHPQLMALRARGVEIVGVAYKDRPAATAAFLNELGNPFSAVGLDPNGRFALELGTTGVPETFVISADGRILAIYRGPLTPEVVEDVIEPALARD